MCQIKRCTRIKWQAIFLHVTILNILYLLYRVVKNKPGKYSHYIKEITEDVNKSNI